MQRVMIHATWYEGTAQLLSLTEFILHLFECVLDGNGCDKRDVLTLFRCVLDGSGCNKLDVLTLFRCVLDGSSCNKLDVLTLFRCLTWMNEYNVRRNFTNPVHLEPISTVASE